MRVHFEKDDNNEDIIENNFENEIRWIPLKKMNTDIFYCNNAYERIEQRALREKLENLMEELTDREQEVLKYRYGFVTGGEKPLEEVGQMLGVTRERIRQIESKALGKMSHPTRIRKLNDFL